jgi:enoyl-CoA hydratase/carnithine racemase
MSGQVTLEIDGSIATITNDNPEKRNAFTDEMDAQLFEILAELESLPDLRAVIWRGEGRPSARTRPSSPTTSS